MPNDEGNYRGKRVKKEHKPVRKSEDRRIDIEKLYQDRRAERSYSGYENMSSILGAVLGLTMWNDKPL